MDKNDDSNKKDLIAETKTNWELDKCKLDVYKLNYSDLVNTFKDNNQEYINHYNKYGKNEKRNCSTIIIKEEPAPAPAPTPALTPAPTPAPIPAPEQVFYYVASNFYGGRIVKITPNSWSLLNINETGETIDSIKIKTLLKMVEKNKYILTEVINNKHYDHVIQNKLGKD
jgi:hypothetical protein